MSKNFIPKDAQVLCRKFGLHMDASKCEKCLYAQSHYRYYSLKLNLGNLRQIAKMRKITMRTLSRPILMYRIVQRNVSLVTYEYNGNAEWQTETEMNVCCSKSTVF